MKTIKKVANYLILAGWLGVVIGCQNSSNQQQSSVEDTSPSPSSMIERYEIEWLTWSPETFNRAETEDKPVLLYLTNKWSHWCQVMETTTYDDPEIIDLIIKNYIPIKVDSDNRPDISRRYNMNGFPSTVFLTPTGEILSGGTYYAPTQMLRELQRVATSYERDKEAIYDKIPEYRAKKAQIRRRQQSSSENFDETVLDEVFKLIRSEFDQEHGGFGDDPKFVNPYALLFLLKYYQRTKNIESVRMIRETLDAMANGGIHDHLGGGFHRYSITQDWILPEFEKIGSQNAELLLIYGHGSKILHDQRYRIVAQGVLNYLGEWLSRRDKPGFYSSQAADRNERDNGGYYTWRRGEAASILLPDEMEAVELYFDIQNRGEMPDIPNRNVLYIANDYHMVAKDMNIDAQSASKIIASAAVKMLDARLQRETPPIDSTLYVDVNASLVSAYLFAGDLLDRLDATAYAEATLDFLLKNGVDDKNGVAHVIDQRGEPQNFNLLLDHVYLLQAVIDAAKRNEGKTANNYIKIAQVIAQYIQDNFADPNYGGYYDIRSRDDAIGELRYPEKYVIDNVLIAIAFIELTELSNDTIYRHWAERTLFSFGGIYLEMENIDISAAYALAVIRFLESVNPENLDQ